MLRWTRAPNDGSMILWYVAGSVFCVWSVFQSSGLDFRMVAIGALAPVVFDAPLGEQAYAHTLLGAVAGLVVAMAVTAGRGRRLLRRRVLGFVIGTFFGLVLAGAWAHREVFWWPAFGADLPHVALLPAWPVVAIEEFVGLLLVRWTYVRFGLADRERLRTFYRTGRLALVAPHQ